MNLSQIGKPNPKEFEFVDPYTNELTGIFVTVHSTKSKIGKSSSIEMQRKIIEARNNQDNLEENGDIKADVQKTITLEWIADLIETWKGVDDDKGKAIKPSKDAYIKAFNESEEFLDAVFMFANESGNFGTKQVTPL